jgi:hypothetical protein
VTASIILRTLTYITGVRSIALAGFKIASSVRHNGFVPTSAGPALTGVDRAYLSAPGTQDSPAGFLESWRAMRAGSGPRPHDLALAFSLLVAPALGSFVPLDAKLAQFHERSRGRALAFNLIVDDSRRLIGMLHKGIGPKNCNKHRRQKLGFNSNRDQFVNVEILQDVPNIDPFRRPTSTPVQHSNPELASALMAYYAGPNSSAGWGQKPRRSIDLRKQGPHPSYEGLGL